MYGIIIPILVNMHALYIIGCVGENYIAILIPTIIVSHKGKWLDLQVQGRRSL